MKFSRDFVRTGGVGDFETTDLDRRSQDVVKNGTIKKVDYSRKPPAYRIGIGNEQDEDDYILTDWIPATGGRAKGDSEAHLFEEGEKVTLLCEGGELATATLVPAGRFTAEGEGEEAPTDKPGVWRKTFKNGAEISYDRNTGNLTLDSKDHGKVTMTESGILLERNGKKATLTNDSFIFEVPVVFKQGMSMSGTGRAATIEGDVRVQGRVWSTDGIESAGPIRGNPTGNGGTVPES